MWQGPPCHRARQAPNHLSKSKLLITTSNRNACVSPHRGCAASNGSSGKGHSLWGPQRHRQRCKRPLRLPAWKLLKFTKFNSVAQARGSLRPSSKSRGEMALELWASVPGHHSTQVVEAGVPQ